jgi:hypothetical protein
LRAEQRVEEIGRLPGLERGVGLVVYLVQFGLKELDLLVGLLLESRIDLPDRLVLLLVEALVPPYHEVGCLGAIASAAARTTTATRLRIAPSPDQTDERLYACLVDAVEETIMR